MRVWWMRDSRRFVGLIFFLEFCERKKVWRRKKERKKRPT